jgi:hypothetical protein
MLLGQADLNLRICFSLLVPDKGQWKLAQGEGRFGRCLGFDFRLRPYREANFRHRLQQPQESFSFQRANWDLSVKVLIVEPLLTCGLRTH